MIINIPNGIKFMQIVYLVLVKQVQQLLNTQEKSYLAKTQNNNTLPFNFTMVGFVHTLL